ncbi:MAG: GIY-YIG nuclease family protein [Phycisphaeraceae bacterium]
MKYVYLLRSESRREKTYVGVTSDYRERLREHNAGESGFTRRFLPWRAVVVTCPRV